MARFIVNKNKQPTGEHEVHNLDVGCNNLPLLANQISLGDHLTCASALSQVQKSNPGRSFDGCKYCAPACHTR